VTHEEDIAALTELGIDMRDRQAVADVYVMYAWLVDCGEWDRVAEEIFTEDAEMSLGTGEPTRGRAAIRRAFERVAEELEGTAHFVTNVRVVLSGDGRALAQAYFQSYHWTRGAVPTTLPREADFVGIGVYLDEFRKERDGWRIARRRRRNLGPSPLGHGAMPPSMSRLLPGWGGSRDE
jgi:ketosteroid isomerase-like protein